MAGLQSSASLSNWLHTMKDDIDGGLAADFDGSLSGLGVELGTATYNMSEALLALPVFKQEVEDQGWQYVLSAPTSPATKINEETLTYLNQGQAYELRLKKLGGKLAPFDGKPKHMKSVIRVVFHERRLQFMEQEQLATWKHTRPGERIVDIDVPLSYGLVEAKVDQRRLNSVEVVWDAHRDAAVFIKVHCISTEFTARKHGGEKGVPFRIQVETYRANQDLVHCASCQIKVFKPKGADRKNKTDREKVEKRPESEKEKYQPSYECTVLTEIPLEQVETYLQQLHKQTAAEEEASSPSPAKGKVKSNAGSPAGKGTGSDNVRNFRVVSEESSSNPADSFPAAAVAVVSLPGGKAGRGDAKAQPVKKSRSSSSLKLKGSAGSDNSPPFAGSSRRRSIPAPPPPPPLPSDTASPPHPASPAVAAEPEPLSAEASAPEVRRWLRDNRFGAFVEVFQHFAGTDLLKLSRDDLIQICGLADGIRLNNALQHKQVRPKLTIYVCQPSKPKVTATAPIPSALPRNTSYSSIPSSGLLTSSTASSVLDISHIHISNQPEVTPVEDLDLPISLASLSTNNGLKKDNLTPAETSVIQQLSLHLQQSAASALTTPSSLPLSFHYQPVTSSTASLPVNMHVHHTPSSLPVNLHVQNPGISSLPVHMSVPQTSLPLSFTIPQSTPSATLAPGQRSPSDSPSPPQGTSPANTCPPLASYKPAQLQGEAKHSGPQGDLKLQSGIVQHSFSPSVVMTSSSSSSKRQLQTEDESSVDDHFFTKKARTRHLDLKRKDVYHAVYLSGSLCRGELVDGLAGLFCVPAGQVSEVYVQGAAGVLVLVTDSVVQNLADHTRYNIAATQDESSKSIAYTVILCQVD